VADGERLAGVTSSLGMQSNETALAIALPAGLAGAVGTVAGAIGAAALSPIFPTGLGRRAEPNPGVRIDWPVLVVGSLVLVAFVAASAIVSARRRVRAQRGSSRTVVRRRRSGLRRGLPVPAALGSGLVLVPHRVRSAVRPASALLGTLLAVTGVLAIAVFTVSQRATADDPIRYGWSWDVDADIPFDDPEPLFAALADDPSFSAVGVANCGQAKIRDDDTLLCAMEVLSGSMPLTYLAGRAPASPDEVVAGEKTMADHDLSIGDRVEVSGDAGVEQRLEVVGVAVMPDTSRPGRGLVTTPDGLRELSGSGNFFPIVTLTYAPGVDGTEVEAVLADDYGLSPDQLTYASPPALVTRLDLVRPTLVALAVFLGALGVIGMVHFLMLSNARRRHEAAVLEAIGFVRTQTIAVVVWQALTIATIGVLLGAPLGVIVGRTAWVASIDQLGIVDTATVPWRFCALVAAGVVVGAGAIGSLTGWRASRRSPAVPLRQE
jgi:hypothetical protein